VFESHDYTILQNKEHTVVNSYIVLLIFIIVIGKTLPLLLAELLIIYY